jgi:hypothetical protein
MRMKDDVQSADMQMNSLQFITIALTNGLPVKNICTSAYLHIKTILFQHKNVPLPAIMTF